MFTLSSNRLINYTEIKYYHLDANSRHWRHPKLSKHQVDISITVNPDFQFETVVWYNHDIAVYCNYKGWCHTRVWPLGHAICTSTDARLHAVLIGRSYEANCYIISTTTFITRSLLQISLNGLLWRRPDIINVEVSNLYFNTSLGCKLSLGDIAFQCRPETVFDSRVIVCQMMMSWHSITMAS